MTQWMLITLGLAVVGQIVYQIGQRAVPKDAAPLTLLAIAYFVAGVLCVAIAWFSGSLTSGSNFRSVLAWPTWVIAGAIVAIEIGYLTAYRTGWTMGTAFATASTVTIVVLALIDWLAHGNALSVQKIVGLVCCCVGVWLLSARALAS
jgi:drug/metabolite transporter (DMT)-like permease